MTELQEFYQNEIQYYDSPEGQNDSDAEQQKGQVEANLKVLDLILTQSKTKVPSGTEKDERGGEQQEADPENLERKIRLEKLIQKVENEYTGFYEERLAQVGRSDSLYGELLFKLSEIKVATEGTSVSAAVEKAWDTTDASYMTGRNFLKQSAQGYLSLKDSTIYHLGAIAESSAEISESEINFAEDIVQDAIEIGRNASERINRNLDRVSGSVEFANSLLAKAEEKVRNNTANRRGQRNL